MSRKFRFVAWCFVFALIAGAFGFCAMAVSVGDYKPIDRCLLVPMFLAVASYGSRVMYAVMGLGTAGLPGIEPHDGSD